MSPWHLALIFMTFWIVGCQQSASLERSSAAGKRPGTSDLNKEPSVKEDEEEVGDTKKKKKKKPIGKKDDGEDDEQSDDDNDKAAEDEGLVYPQLSFNGKGYTTYELKDRLSMTMGIETRLDESELTIDTKTAKVECGSKSGCKQNDVDASVNANSIGANVYQRVKPNHLLNLKKEGFNAAKYAIFAVSVRGKNGITYTFDKPIPVYPWPAAKSRYNALNSGAETWSTTATADRYIPLKHYISLEEAGRSGENQERIGNARKSFAITMTVTKSAGESNGEVMLTFDLNISEDKDRMAYKYFPIPKTSTFTINTTKRDVIGANMINWSNGDKSKKAEESVLNYKLCTKTTPDDVKQYPCD